MDDVDQVRSGFRPPQVTTLFVGESPPNRGTFFYNENSSLYSRMQESFGWVGNFLEQFKAKGFFLDDLVLYPINQIKSKGERDRRRRGGVAPLAKRMADYRPSAVVALMYAIESMVANAMRQANLADVPLYVVPFPGRPRERKLFKELMAGIIPKLPVASIPLIGRPGKARRVSLPAPVAAIYKAVQELECRYRGRKFTPDGHLDGSIGEVIAAEALNLTLYPMSHKDHDAWDANGPVQVKMTAGSSIAMYECCFRLVVLKVISPEEAEFICDGPGEAVWANAGKMQKNGQRTISISKLRKLVPRST